MNHRESLSVSDPKPDIAASGPGPSEGDLLDLVYEAGLLPECRISPRRKITVPMNAVPIDSGGRPSGSPFVAESRNLSASGICLSHSEPVNAKFLLVEIPGANSAIDRVVVEIVRSARLNDGGYQIAGRFVTLPPPLISPGFAAASG